MQVVCPWETSLFSLFEVHLLRRCCLKQNESVTFQRKALFFHFMFFKGYPAQYVFLLWVLVDELLSANSEHQGYFFHLCQWQSHVIIGRHSFSKPLFYTHHFVNRNIENTLIWLFIFTRSSEAQPGDSTIASNRHLQLMLSDYTAIGLWMLVW